MQAVYAEIGGEIESVTTDFLLTARADRIERADATAASPCSTTRPASRRPQSRCKPGLRRNSRWQAAILRHGGFQGRGRRQAPRLSELLYVRLRGGDPAGETGRRGIRESTPGRGSRQGACTADAVVATIRIVETSLSLVLAADVVGRSYGDYDHLARVKEWSALGGEDDGDAE